MIVKELNYRRFDSLARVFLFRIFEKSLPRSLDQIPSILAFSARPKAAKRASPSAFLISSPTKEGRDARVARLGKDESRSLKQRIQMVKERTGRGGEQRGDHLPGRDLKRDPRHEQDFGDCPVRNPRRIAPKLFIFGS